MRSVAPDRPGSAASQTAGWLLYAKPMVGSWATTTLHTSHTEKARSRHGMDIQRFLTRSHGRKDFQNSGSSGRQSVNVCPCRPAVLGLLCSSRLLLHALAGAVRITTPGWAGWSGREAELPGSVPCGPSAPSCSGRWTWASSGSCGRLARCATVAFFSMCRMAPCIQTNAVATK